MVSANGIGAAEGGRAGLFLLWFSVLTGPTAWAVRLVGSYMLVAVTCDVSVVGPPVMGLTITEWLVLLLTGVTAVASLVAGVVGWRIWKSSNGNWGIGNNSIGGRNGFLGLTGFFMGIFFLLVILLEGSAIFFLGVCD
jgi:hypothetical protein